MINLTKEQKKLQPTLVSRVGIGVEVHDLTHVRHSPSHVLAPGLFRSLGPGDQKRLKLDITYIHGNNQIEFQGFEPLGCLDLRVLQGLIAMAGPDGRMLRDDDFPRSEGEEQLLRDLFKPLVKVDNSGVRKPDALTINDSLRNLARAIGMSEGGSALIQIKKSIERLFGVTVFIQVDKKRLGMRLLSTCASTNRGDLFVALNPRLAEAIMGETQHVRIELNEVRALNTDPARFIHQRLCGFIDAGQRRSVSMNTLMGYVWPEPVSESGTRWRRMKVHAAMNELVAVGWFVTERKAIFTITRPRSKTLRKILSKTVK